MLVNNNVMFEKDQQLLVYKETGKFFVEVKDLGNKVNVFQLSMLQKKNDTFANYNINDKGLNIYNVKRRNRYFAYIKAFFKAQSIIRRSNFIYIYYPGPICVFLAFCAILHRKKFGLYVRGEQGFDSSLSKILFKKAQFVNTISPKFTDLITSFGGKAFTIRPMIELGEKDIVEDRIYTCKENYNLLYVGRVVEDKGVFELVESVAALIEKHKNLSIKLTMIGDGSDLNKLQAFAKELGIESNIDFKGTITDRIELSNHFLNADLFILPTHHEGFPRVLYEAMILGVPIVTTFVGTISYLMIDQVNCMEIKPKDVTNQIQILESILLDYNNKAKMAIKGTQTIKEYLADKKYSHAEQLHNLVNGNS